jgi:hypothetical protein
MSKNRPTLSGGPRKKLVYELTPRSHELLKAAAKRENTTQVMLLELMIREYCKPEKTSERT